MFFHLNDTRTPLKTGDLVETAAGSRIIIDRYVGSGGFSLMYIAHHEGSSRYLALKELFPRQLENLLVQRAEDGTIVICDPAAETAGEAHAPIWQELQQYFHREAALTRRAGAVFDRAGHQAAQNNPDVLHAEGPFRDLRGNTYLAIDTYQGESLRDLIERGFLRDAQGNVLANHLLEEILDILMETALRLSALHAAGLWHLDLSPDNIYVVPTAGRTRLTPYIIDYGSAFDRSDPDHAASHRYTHNPFSAPEILALAQLQDPACGYAPDPSSDTYALASILFYAVTGQVFTADHRISGGWREQIRREYAAGLPCNHGADSFAASLVDFFGHGLAALQSDRLRSPRELLENLRSLRSGYRQYGNLLPLVAQDELMSYMVLEKYPLYRYRSGDGHIHVLCLGSGVFVRRMILSLISCGQLSGSRLYIHVVSAEPEEHLQAHLRSAAPALALYSNPGAPAGREYVTFSYHRVRDVLDETVCQEVLARHADCRYILVSLGSNRSNIDAARLYAARLAMLPDGPDRQTVLNYYCSEDAANNIYAGLDRQSLPKWLEVDAFGANLSAYSDVIRTLGLRSLKLAHLYNKLDDPRISLAESARQLATDEYSQRSSCAAALHLKYKLASVGINPAPSTTRRAIIGAYQKVLSGSRFGTLLELEHRRWMMYMIADGYRAPTTVQLERYGFERVDNSFNAAWKCKSKRLHPCLVPCDADSIRLQNDDWTACATAKAIEDSAFDPLDKISLTLHMLAKKKCCRILESGDIARLFQQIAARLANARLDAEEDPQRSVDAIPFDALGAALNKVRSSILLETEKLHYTDDCGQLQELLELFGKWDINIEAEITALRQTLSVFTEYTARRDYKKPDETIIRHLLWILYAEGDTTCIKLRGRTIADNITAPLVLEPHRLVYFGLEPRPEWDAFLRSHGNPCEIAYLPHCGNTVEQLTRELTRTAAQHRGGCIIDITGADEQMVIAAQRVADANGKVALIRCTPEGRVENIQRFPTAAAYTLNTTIAAEEIFALHGARKHPSGERYMEQLEDTVPVLWSFFRQFRSNWNDITAFFANRGGDSPELHIFNVRIDATTVWKPFELVIDKAKWTLLELGNVFRTLTDAGILRDLEKEPYLTGRLRISLLYPSNAEGHSNAFLPKALEDFFCRKVHSIFVPLRCRIRQEHESYVIDVSSGCCVEIRDTRSTTFTDSRYQYSTKPIPYDRVLPALQWLSDHQLITDLYFSEDPSKLPVNIRFTYADPALRTCLATAGNILELYIWWEAKRSHAFDHVMANLAFAWKEGIDNELDVVLTRGLTSLIVSAKTTRFNREHLYEVKYLTEHFSLNSKPVIVYASPRAFTQTIRDEMAAVKKRARAMGVYLLDLNELDQKNEALGDRLAAIADGTAPL